MALRRSVTGQFGGLGYNAGMEQGTWRLHRVTWGSQAAVVIALAYCQIGGQLGLTPLVPGGYWNQTHHGWPWRAVERNSRGKWVDGAVGRFAYGPARVTWSVRPRELAANVACWLALLAGTAYACESRLRQSGGWWQLRLADLLLWTAVAAAMLGWWRAEELRYAGEDFQPDTAVLLRIDARTPFHGPWAPWFVRGTLLLASAATIYALFSACAGLLRRAGRCAARRAMEPARALRPRPAHLDPHRE